MIWNLYGKRNYTVSTPHNGGELDSREVGRFNLMKLQYLDDESILSRRDALAMIAGLPLSFLIKMPQEPTTTFVEEFLVQCAASITACWHLMKGSQLFVVEEVLSAYLPTLATFAQQATKYRKTAASLTTQGYRLNGIVALHRNDPLAREMYFQKAAQYSEIAENAGLQVSALISLGYHNQDPIQAAQIYQRALLHKDAISPLLLSRLYIELSVAYARMRQEQEALGYMRLAQEIYPEYPENDPSFLYAEFSPSGMILEEGLTHLALAHHYPDREYPQQTWDTFARVEKLQTTFPVPERIRVEIINYQAKTALALKNLDAFCACLKQGILGASVLGSKRRRQEAIDVYKDARKLWPKESHLRDLADLFL